MPQKGHFTIKVLKKEACYDPSTSSLQTLKKLEKQQQQITRKTLYTIKKKKNLSYSNNIIVFYLNDLVLVQIRLLVF